MEKIILIGRGESVSRCTKEFVDSHDTVAIINNILYTGYEHLVSNHADIIFGNRTCLKYSNEQAKNLGLKQAIFTGKPNQQFNRELVNVKNIYPNPNLRDAFMKQYKFDPSSGVQAIYYFINQKKYKEISLVGFDFYELGSKPYYFKPEEAPAEQRYLWNGAYKGDRINVPSGHDTAKSINYLKDVIINHPEITFNIISNSKRVNEIEADNLNILNNEKPEESNNE